MTLKYDITGIDDVAKLIVTKAKHKTILFNGEMGAGKTTLIKAICLYLGVTDNVTSPSFSLVNEYQGSKDIIYHFDFYRINDEDEAYAIGFDEYEYSGDLLFIEWSEKIPNLIPEDSHVVEIQIEDNQLRTLTFN